MMYVSIICSTYECSPLTPPPTPLVPAPKLSRVGVVNTSYDAGDLVRGKFEAFLHSLVYKKPSQPGGGGEVPSEANEAEQQAKAMH